MPGRVKEPFGLGNPLRVADVAPAPSWTRPKAVPAAIISVQVRFRPNTVSGVAAMRSVFRICAPM
jgi:hypothetical protein